MSLLVPLPFSALMVTVMVLGGCLVNWMCSIWRVDDLFGRRLHLLPRTLPWTTYDRVENRRKMCDSRGFSIVGTELFG